MVTGGRTPEELETLFEDALLLRDREAAAQLFETRGLLVVGGGLPEARGWEAIARIAADVSQSRCLCLTDRRMSRASWNFGGGLVSIRLRSRLECRTRG